jgi:hypothetical protein
MLFKALLFVKEPKPKNLVMLQDMLPPPLAAPGHGKSSSQIVKFDRPRLKPQKSSSRYATRSARLTQLYSPASRSLPPARLFRISLFKTPKRKLRLRNFDTELHYPYCYRFEPYDRWESVANAHTAADLHVRPGP